MYNFSSLLPNYVMYKSISVEDISNVFRLGEFSRVFHFGSERFLIAEWQEICQELAVSQLRIVNQES